MKQILQTSIAAATLSITMALFAHAADAPTSSTPTRAQMMEQGQQIAQTKCAACHGVDGMSLVSAYPNLAGLPEQYIAAQLELFKSGKRKNEVMRDQVKDMDAAAMRAVGAFYFAQRGKPNATAKSAALADLGRKIFRAGIPERKVPACAGCHGAAGAGIPSAYPRLAGQWPEYTLEELQHYASGERVNAVMQPIAARMQENERKAVAEFIAGLRAR
jgi:cytochrome c553